MAGAAVDPYPFGESPATFSLVRRLIPKASSGDVLGTAPELRRDHHGALTRRRPWTGKAQVNGVELWYQITGEGEPVIQIHGAGFGHSNFAPATPALGERFSVIDYDMRGYGQSDRPVQHYDMEVWADDAAGLLDALDVPEAHVHGTSMGGMIAIVFAAKYPERTTSVVINCAAAKLGVAGRLVFKNWIDIARMDPDGPGSRILAELIAWQALSKSFLETPEGIAAIDTIQQILRDSNRVEVFTAACQAMCDMDLTGWLPRITAPALVLGGSEDHHDALGPGAERRGAAGDRRRDPRRRDVRHRGLEPLDALRQHRRARAGGDGLLHAAHRRPAAAAAEATTAT